MRRGRSCFTFIDKLVRLLMTYGCSWGICLCGDRSLQDGCRKAVAYDGGVLISLDGRGDSWDEVRDASARMGNLLTSWIEPRPAFAFPSASFRWGQHLASYPFIKEHHVERISQFS